MTQLVFALFTFFRRHIVWFRVQLMHFVSRLLTLINRDPQEGNKREQHDVKKKVARGSYV